MEQPTPAAELEALSDRLWGRGNWVLCTLCLDGLGNPSRHHWNNAACPNRAANLKS